MRRALSKNPANRYESCVEFVDVLAAACNASVNWVPLPRGAHEYMFLVDGTWVTDPAAPETRPDGFGRTNAILRL